MFFLVNKGGYIWLISIFEIGIFLIVILMSIKVSIVIKNKDVSYFMKLYDSFIQFKLTTNPCQIFGSIIRFFLAENVPRSIWFKTTPTLSRISIICFADNNIIQINVNKIVTSFVYFVFTTGYRLTCFRELELFRWTNQLNRLHRSVISNDYLGSQWFVFIFRIGSQLTESRRDKRKSTK